MLSLWDGRHAGAASWEPGRRSIAAHSGVSRQTCGHWWRSPGRRAARAVPRVIKASQPKASLAHVLSAYAPYMMVPELGGVEDTGLAEEKEPENGAILSGGPISSTRSAVGLPASDTKTDTGSARGPCAVIRQARSPLLQQEIPGQRLWQFSAFTRTYPAVVSQDA